MWDGLVQAPSEVKGTKNKKRKGINKKKGIKNKLNLQKDHWFVKATALPGDMVCDLSSVPF